MTTPDELERLQRLEKLVIRARAGGHDDVLTEALRLLGQIIRLNHPDPAGDGVPPVAPDPMTRTRVRARGTGPLDERQADGLHKLRRGRDQCGATRRDGGQCEAPAIPGGLVCRRHGGSAPQVAIKAEYTENLVRVYSAQREYEEARGTPREFDALCKISQAERDLEAYQIKLRLLREFRAGLKPPGQQSLDNGGRNPHDPPEALHPSDRPHHTDTGR